MGIPFVSIGLMGFYLLLRGLARSEQRKGCSAPPLLAPLLYAHSCNYWMFFRKERVLEGTFVGDESEDFLYQQRTLGGVTLQKEIKEVVFCADDGSEYPITDKYIIVAKPEVKGVLQTSLVDFYRVVSSMIGCFVFDDGVEPRRILATYYQRNRHRIEPVDGYLEQYIAFNQLLLVERYIRPGDRGVLKLQEPYPAVGVFDLNHPPRVEHGGYYYFGIALEYIANIVFVAALLSLFFNL